MFGTAASLSAQYGAPSRSQYPPSQQQDPQQGVARLSIVLGDVNVKRGDSGDWVAGAINAPLLTQDHVQTSPGARAEIQLDYANMIRLAPNTELGFADLENHRYQVQLGAGTIIYRVLRDSNAPAEIDTPSIALRPTQQGNYLISVLDDGSTQISVNSGALEVYSPRGTQNLEAGQTMLVRGDSSDPQFQMTDQLAPDQFDDWSANRDRQLLASRSYQYVSPDVYGADDLDTYGSWVPSQYGNVWEPRDTGADWAPYSQGQWVSEPYYGWTWVDDEPWGWAPYHYGRWFDNPGHGWCWLPGSIDVSYSWSPAVVGFFGWGGFGIGFSGGGVGWVALAPFESFDPWWGGGFGGGGYGNYTSINNTTINNINIVNNRNITNVYRNAGVKGGAVTAPYNKFGGPNHQFSRATQVQLRNANLFRGRIPVTPTRASSQFSNRQAQPNPRLAAAANRQFFQHQAPPSARASSTQQGQSQPGSRQLVGGGANARPGGLQRMGQTAPNGVQRGQFSGPSQGSVSNMARNSGVPSSTMRTPEQNSHGMPSKGQAPGISRGIASGVPENSGMNSSRINAAPRSSHGLAPNMRAPTIFAASNHDASTRPSSGSWPRFGQPGISTGSPRSTAVSEQSGWHSFGQPQRASASYSGALPGSVQTQPRYGRSFGAPSYTGNYQSRPLTANQPASRSPQSSFAGRANYNDGGRSTYSAGSMPHYNKPSAAPRYSAPSMPHYNTPSAPRNSAPSMPHYNAPAAPRYNAPSMPHYNAPSTPQHSGAGAGRPSGDRHPGR